MNQFLNCIGIAVVLLIAYYIYRQQTGEGYGSISGQMSSGKGCRVKHMTYISKDGDLKNVKCWSCDHRAPPSNIPRCSKIVAESGSAAGWRKTGKN